MIVIQKKSVIQNILLFYMIGIYFQTFYTFFLSPEQRFYSNWQMDMIIKPFPFRLAHQKLSWYG